MAVTLRNMPAHFKLTLIGIVAFILLIQLFLCWRWSREPSLYLGSSALGEVQGTTGYVTVSSLIGTIDWLIEKPGGYLSNDIYLPSRWLDNMPNFEFGVLVQSRDLARVLRDNYSRSQLQPIDQPALTVAEPALNYANDRWVIPSTQSEFRKAQNALIEYRSQLVSLENNEVPFYASTDNLRAWLAVVERRLGDLSQSLSASVGQTWINTGLSGESDAEAPVPRESLRLDKTPWTQLDDVFFQAMGTAWALLQFMAAAQVDFDGPLTDRNAALNLQQVIRELEGALDPIRSPIILNGCGYGFFANHSLVLASYISRAHSAVIDLRELLAQG